MRPHTPIVLSALVSTIGFASVPSNESGAAAWAPTSVSTPPKSMCLNDSVPSSDLERQPERIRVAFGLTPYAAPGSKTVDFYGAALTPDEYAQVLLQMDYQSQLSSVQGQLEAQLGSEYGGAVICHSLGGLVQIRVESESGSLAMDARRQATQQFVEASGLLKDVPFEIIPVEFSLSELRATRQLVEDSKAELLRRTAGVIITSRVEIEKNSVSVGIDGPLDTAAVDQVINDARRASGDLGMAGPLPNLELVPAQAGSLQVGFENMRAGNEILRTQQSHGDNTWCSASGGSLQQSRHARSRRSDSYVRTDAHRR